MAARRRTDRVLRVIWRCRCGCQKRDHFRDAGCALYECPYYVACTRSVDELAFPKRKDE